MSPRRRVQPPRRRPKIRQSTDAVQASRSQAELAADARHEGLTVTHRFDPGSEGVPFAATVLVPVDDGWRRARVPQTVFLIWDGKDSVRALSSACTHLGCRVAFDAESKRFACPCHGGFYDVQGQVVAGPPPAPLAVLDARAVVERDEVMVRV